ncbi:MAG: hypothetical protein IPI77_11875 [Saprospiraceae bacterium]|nr:hypothetical protein [Saprospiraceae bacterium]
MNSHVAAFADLSSVQNHQTKYPGEILKWDALLLKARLIYEISRFHPFHTMPY